MHDPIQHPKPPVVDKDTARMESFSDGVFSIALTLLVLELTVPKVADHQTSAQLWAALRDQWPSYFAFVTSFATVLIMWINHHGIFRLIRRSDGTLQFANGFLLLIVTVVPFPTSLLAKYLLTPAAPVACVVYGGTYVFISAGYTLLLMAARRGGGHLLMPGSMDEVNHRFFSCMYVGFPLYLISAVAAWFSPALCLLICSGLWIFWVWVGARGNKAFAS
jgi:uncharacterized membrane protein